MKTTKLLFLLFTIMFGIGVWISGIWVIVEFLIYLVKDKPFNWISVILFIICMVFTVILDVFRDAVKKIKASNELENIRIGKSKWQQRLDEAAKKKGYKEPTIK